MCVDFNRFIMVILYFFLQMKKNKEIKADLKLKVFFNSWVDLRESCFSRHCINLLVCCVLTPVYIAGSCISSTRL